MNNNSKNIFPPKLAVSSSKAFTLIELLIVIGLLGAIAALVISNYSTSRTDMIDESIVESELADIQKAFQKLNADCILTDEDLKKISHTGLDILCQKPDESAGWSFPVTWDNQRQKGWRGPYLTSEGTVTISNAVDSYGAPVTPAQQEKSSGTTLEIATINTPYADDKDGVSGDYYRVIAELEAGEINQLWVVFPSHSGSLPGAVDDPESYPLKRRLLIK